MVPIIDASVAIKWFVEEKGRESALEILQNILESPQTHAVPELFYFELANAFNRLVPVPNEGQLKLMDQVLVLALRRFSMTGELFDLTRKYQRMGLSGYDASYVALAKMLKGIWLTFDETAHRKIAPLKISRLLA
ncbi:MAG: type II toxin-antitoxin system VapC family toxin [Deltaproteobacteria bacterium]|nr:type II toxin-antitoxin system VapC family toxin [Deltaproteobacteria bacterium]